MNHSDINSEKLLANYLRCDITFLSDFIKGKINLLVLDNKDPSHHVLINEVESMEALIAAIGQATKSEIQHRPILVNKMYIPKRNKSLGKRIVYSIWDNKFADVLKGLNTQLSSVYKPQDTVHGFVHGRNIKSNASVHLGKKFILSIDIKCFFESIYIEMITAGLQKLGFTENAATWISKLTTIDGCLVQGFNTSPTIANIVADEMDRQLGEACGDRISYTRYADDLYFSSNEPLPEATLFEKIINGHGFELNSIKTKSMKRGQNQYVTGLTVFDSQYPRIPRKVKRGLRLELYYINKFGIESHLIKKLGYTVSEYEDSDEVKKEVHEQIRKFDRRIRGWITFIKSIEPKVADYFGQQFLKKYFESMDLDLEGLEELFPNFKRSLYIQYGHRRDNKFGPKN